jgi:uncharacterized membrane protein YqjE
MAAHPDANAAHDMSAGDLVRQLSEQMSTLARQEVDLAKAELTEKGKQAGIGAGMFGTAGLLGIFGLAGLTAALILGLAQGMDGWVAALIVGLVYLAGAGVAALVARDRVKEATPLAPEQTIETVKEDVQWAKNRAKSGIR